MERYVKIVHPVAHRKYYRQWMVYVGVALPWVNGLVTATLPSMATAKWVKDHYTAVYPNQLTSYAMRVFWFCWRFVIPLTLQISVLCLSRIQ